MRATFAAFRRSGERASHVTARPRRRRNEPPVTEEELELVAREYRHVHAEHHRAPPRSRTRRRLEARLRRLRQQFERLLARAPVTEHERERLRALLHARPAAIPAGEARPVVFRGRSDAGDELTVTAGARDTFDARVGGTSVAVLDGVAELDRTTPDLVFGLDGVGYRETFASSPAARAGLRTAVEAGRTPEAGDVRELIEDGLLDRTLGLTPRGRRALALDRDPARHTGTGLAPQISTRGRVSRSARDLLARRLAEVVRVAPRPVLHVTASLVRHDDPANTRPFVAKAALDVNGRLVRARVAAASESEAIDLLDDRLERNLRILSDRAAATRRDDRPPEPGEWRHRDLAATRPPVFPRPVDERRIVRRTTYASEPLTPADARVEMELLDYEFHLFVDAEDGVDSLVYVRRDGAPGLLRAEDAPTLTIEAATARLDTGDEPFVYFVDAASNRGAVAYRRYDGHYGLVTAVTPP